MSQTYFTVFDEGCIIFYSRFSPLKIVTILSYETIENNYLNILFFQFFWKHENTPVLHLLEAKYAIFSHSLKLDFQ
jgi:hypothetical protein